MADIQLSKAKVLTFDYIFAFPGMGKTPAALNNARLVDADFGYFRSAFKVDKDKERVLFKPYKRLIDMWVKDGYIVLSNQPDLISMVPRSKAIVMLPKDSTYSARKMKVDKVTVDGWIQGWATTARESGVPVMWLDTGLDKFLK